MAQARNEIQLSLELIGEALKVDKTLVNAITMPGNLELKTNDWLKAKETIKAAQNVSDGKDAYADINSLGNWNYFAASHNEKKDLDAEGIHLDKARELYCKVLA